LRINTMSRISLGALTACIQIAACAAAPAAHAGRVAPARAARTLKATDTAHLRYIHASGTHLIEEGSVTGTLPGTVQAHIEVGATISGIFTFRLHNGTIRGRGRAVPFGSGLQASLSGTFTVTGGSGRYAHARGRASLHGTINRRTYALVITTSGTLDF
jgi:hypothetical protein